MLLGIDPLLGPDLLAALRAMGHGDCIVLADANFPAAATAGVTTVPRPIELAGVGVVRALRAVLSVLPLDSFVPAPVVSMQVVGQPESEPPIVQRMQEVLSELAPQAPPIAAVERHAFYAKARQAYAVVGTGERAFYGNLILQKGVIPPESEPA